MFDLVLRNGVIVDGSGGPRYVGDVGIKDGLIQEIGEVDERSREVMDISGLVVAPGFIDTHSHSDLYLIHEPSSLPKIMQGITSEIIGQDGLGEAPIRSEDIVDWRRYLSGLNGDPPIEWSWNSFKEYLEKLEASNTATNVASLVGHGNLRLYVMGMEDRDPTISELEEMKKLLRTSLAEGAIGLSTGLIYAPCIYSKTEELVDLCRVVSAFNGVFVVHMRDEGNLLLESIDEVLRIARESGVGVHISHFKASGPGNWGKSLDALKKLEEATDEGLRVSYDQYPYTAGSTFLSSLLPSWIHEGGVGEMLKRLKDSGIRARVSEEYGERVDRGRTAGWDKVLVTFLESSENKRFEGMFLSEIAVIRGQTPVDVLIDLVVEEENMASMANFTMSEDDLTKILGHPLGMVCTDGLLLGKPHPRAYGAFPRVLGKYVREQRVIGLEDAVRRMTGYPCIVFGLGNRGLIEPGYVADLVVFDPDKIQDASTYENPRVHPKGMHHIIVSGELTVRNGEYTGKNKGKILSN